MKSINRATIGLILGCVLILARPAEAQSHRLAMVIGIGGYDARVGRLPKAENDAKSVGAALEKIGFQVTQLFDVSREEWLQETNKFTSSMSAGDVVLVYYAGHGVQINGGNYLLPSDFSGVDSDVPGQGILLDDLIQQINARSPRLKIIVIDACRDNPFDKKSKPGLANMNAVAYGSGTYIAMAASPGQLATDGLFAKHFVAALARPALEVREVFTEVRKGVGSESGGREVPFGADLVSENYLLTPSNAKRPLELVRALKAGVVHSATLSPDGRVVAFTGDDGPVQLWSIETGKAIGLLTGPEKAGLSVQFSPDSKLLAAGGEKAVWVWDVDTKKSRKLEDKGMGTVVSSSFSFDGKFLVSSSTDKKLRVWNIDANKLEASLKLPSQGVWTAFVPGQKGDSVLVLEGDAKQQAGNIWNWRTNESTVMSANLTGVRYLAFAPNGRTLVGGMPVGDIRLWDLADIGRAAPSRTFEGHTSALEAVVFSSDGTKFVSAGADKTVRWWDPENARQLRSMDLAPGTQKVLALSFLVDGRLLAATVRAGEVEIWRIPLP